MSDKPGVNITETYKTEKGKAEQVRWNLKEAAVIILSAIYNIIPNDEMVLYIADSVIIIPKEKTRKPMVFGFFQLYRILLKGDFGFTIIWVNSDSLLIHEGRHNGRKQNYVIKNGCL